MTPASDPKQGNIGKYREKYKNRENRIFALYGSWEALDGCKILPRDVGIISTLADTFPENLFFGWYIFLFLRKYGFAKNVFFYMYRSKCYYQTDRMDRGIISRFQRGELISLGNSLPNTMSNVGSSLFMCLYNWCVSLWVNNPCTLFIDYVC